MGWGSLAERVQAAGAEPALEGGEGLEEAVQGILLGTGGPLSITLYPVLLPHWVFVSSWSKRLWKYWILSELQD